MPPRRLYQLGSSPYCRKVRWVLRRKGLDAETLEVGEGTREELSRLTGQERAPVLVAGEDVVMGSTAIAHYLERVHAEPSIFPADPQKRNQAVTFDEFADKAIGWLARSLAGGEARWEIDLGDPIGDPPEKIIAGLRQALGQVREAIGRRALDSGACHLGDIAVAAHLAACREIPELDFQGQYTDLLDYIERVRRLLASR